MGCGQSKIHLYPRKSKSKANGKKGGHGKYQIETNYEKETLNITILNKSKLFLFFCLF